MSKRQTLFLALVASTPLLALWTLHLFAPHAMVVSNNLHIYAVGWASLLATVAALILTIVGARRGDARSVLVGTAFSTMAGILMVHGLSTPGYIVGYTEVISFSAGATLPVGGVLLALTALPALQRRAHVRALLLLQLVLVLGVVALGVIGMQDPGIVRHRLKVESTVNNAQRVAELDESLSDYLWSFVGGEPLVNTWRKLSELPAETAESKAMSKDLKKRGFRFVGPTICYAFMQACGLVNDHTVDCFRYAELSGH